MARRKERKQWRGWQLKEGCCSDRGGVRVRIKRKDIKSGNAVEWLLARDERGNEDEATEGIFFEKAMKVVEKEG